MSREIKFRCWSNEEGQYFPIQTVNFVDNKPISVGYHKKGHKGFLHMRFPKFILEQYTGLKDKNGKEIYEGDIVEEDIDFNSKMTDGTFRYKVYWDDDELCWSLEPISRESIHNDLWELNSSCRAIGNIHENPELLEDENE